MKLVATHITSAPIRKLFSLAAGTYSTIGGEVDFTPSANGHYLVQGELKPSGSSVWIADAQTKERVSEMVTGP